MTGLLSAGALMVVSIRTAQSTFYPSPTESCVVEAAALSGTASNHTGSEETRSAPGRRRLTGMAGTEFEQAVAAVSDLTDDPGNDTKLRLYALYKQATVGDVSGKRPGFLDLVGRAKYDAWAALAGVSTEAAEADYVTEVARLTGR